MLGVIEVDTILFIYFIYLFIYNKALVQGKTEGGGDSLARILPEVKAVRE